MSRGGRPCFPTAQKSVILIHLKSFSIPPTKHKCHEYTYDVNDEAEREKFSYHGWHHTLVECLFPGKRRSCTGKQTFRWSETGGKKIGGRWVRREGKANYDVVKTLHWSARQYAHSPFLPDFDHEFVSDKSHKQPSFSIPSSTIRIIVHSSSCNLHAIATSKRNGREGIITVKIIHSALGCECVGIWSDIKRRFAVLMMRCRTGISVYIASAIIYSHINIYAIHNSLQCKSFMQLHEGACGDHVSLRRESVARDVRHEPNVITSKVCCLRQGSSELSVSI